MKMNKLHPVKITFKIFVFLVIAMLAFGNVGVTPTLASTPKAPLLRPASDEVIPDQYIVIYKRGTMNAQADISIRASVEANGGQVQYVYTSALKGFSAHLPEAALNAVLSDPNVAYVEPDVIISLSPEERGDVQDSGDIAAEDVNAQAVQTPATWGLDRIDQRNLPITNSYAYTERGTNVHVYVLDTGIRTTHNEFIGRALRGEFDSIGDGQNGNDCDGHGTHVAGTIGGTTYGVAKLARLHSIRVLNCFGSGSYSGVIAGVDWVANNHIKPAVANMSLGGPTFTTLDNAVNGAVNKGVVMVVAAGNDNLNACNYSPARASKAITVGSTTSSDTRSSFSNYGSCLDIFAPGSSITSAWYTSNSATNTISGTSMAAPHVAGVAALYLEVQPNANPFMVTYGIINASTIGKVTNPVGSANRLLFSRQVVTPKLITPSGNISDTTPTFQWKYVFAATVYRFQVYEGSTLIYTQTVNGSASCAGLVCSSTPSTVLPSGAYKWRAQAKIDGVWESLSSFKTFNVGP